ncbi:PREDICTED: pentatricopeptide repeat-containing protein At3g62470, mitochondrial [Camelina sativa]|uniref:Pentatricopeptide repeat-containing protein At3g62470, mitochondrial n=1 Tax=Camelina sativa TaxID=90675 RepID=A0ABM0SM53_CAMSA|nr:PREDICTED: pentatricopeptide repeat-containing protein At3g62470, mitochondrial [Camelina sativa]
MALRRSSIKTPRSFQELRCPFIRSPSFNSDEFISGRGEEEVRFSGGSSFPFSRLFHSSIHHPPLPHSSIVLLDGSLGFRGFSSNSSDEIESEDDNDEIEVSCVESSTTNHEEVERVCKVIDELFALDRNMEAVLDEMKVDLSHDLIVEVLERFRHARKPAFRFFCWAAEQPGFAHDSRTYNSMMSILAKTRQFETMVSVLEEMGTKGLLTMDTFTIAMKAFAAAKERKKAVGIFELMKKYKFKIGVETINCLLDSLGRAKLGKEAQVLFDKLKERFTPNMMTYTVLLNGWCRVRNLMEAARIWNDMIDQGLKPDIVAHNVMLEGLLRSRKKSDAIKLFHVMKSKGPSPSVRSYTIMIRDFCKQSSMETAVEYFDDMIDSGLQPDAAVYTCLITGFGTQKKLDTVYQLLEEMQEKGHPPDGKTYNALIKLMANQKMPEHATRVYDKMIQNEIEPSIHTFNMIMKSYFMARNYEMGRAVWDEMIKKGICPDDNSYTVLIRGLIGEGKSREACRYLEEMLDKGMKTPVIDYNKFAADFYRGGQPEIFEELAQRAKFSGKFAAAEIFARWAQMTRRKFKQRYMED